MAKRGRPKKTESTEPKEWLERVKRGREAKEAWKEQFRVALAMEYWEGRQRPPDVPVTDWITINMFWAILQSELPTLYGTDPYFYVRLKRSYRPDPAQIAQYEQNARVRQGMLNYLKGELDLKGKARLSIFDAFFQYGVLKVHLRADLEENPEAGKPLSDDDGNEIPDLLQPDFLPVNEEYKVTRVHPDDFWVDADAGPCDPDDVRWKCQRILRPLEDVKEDPSYQAAARKKVKATALSEDLRKRQERKRGLVNNREKDPEPDTVVVYEVWDLARDKWFVLADGLEDEYLRPPEDVPEGIEGDPFAVLRFVPRDDSWYPYPPTATWIDPQREFCESRSKLLSHLKRSKRVLWVNEAAFDDADDAIAQIETGPDLTILRARPNVGEYPAGNIPDAPLDQQLHTQIAYLRKDFEDLAIGSNQRGSSVGVDSATEAGILERRSQVREGDKLGLVADFVTNVARKIDQLVSANLSTPQAVRVTGPQGEYWQAVDPNSYEDIDGEYEYAINIGATTPQLPEIERAQWTAFLGLVANAPQLLLSKSLLKKQAQLHHIEDEGLVDELHEIGRQMMSGQLPTTQTQGSLPGMPDAMTRPASSNGGAAAGVSNVRGGLQ